MLVEGAMLGTASGITWIKGVSISSHGSCHHSPMAPIILDTSQPRSRSRSRSRMPTGMPPVVIHQSRSHSSCHSHHYTLWHLSYWTAANGSPDPDLEIRTPTGMPPVVIQHSSSHFSRRHCHHSLMAPLILDSS